MNPILFNPIWERFDLSFASRVETYNEPLDYNHYSLEINGKETHCFMKTIPLVDYIKLLIGKYKNYDLCVLPTKENITHNIYEEYIHSIHNYAYVDNFFYILSNKLNTSNYQHGIEVYDSFIAMKENCEINIVDDFEYLCDSNYFNEYLNKLFYFKDTQMCSLFSNLKKEPIEVSTEDCPIVCDTLDTIDVEPCEVTLNELPNLVHESAIEADSDYETESDSDVSQTETESVTESEKDSNETSESSDGSESNSSSEHSFVDELILVLKKVPTQNILLEKCVNTLDSLFESDDISIEQLTSAIFQTVVMLYLYQNVYEFTHNDLHTNNIMYVDTSDEFLYYKIKDQHYKVPTYGKIYKLIDFGRSIYTYRGVRLCSDSFSPNGTAHGQYNCEPFLNKHKPTLEPNYSFDLCRLACSMFDFIIEDLDDIEAFRTVPVYDMIIGWVYDDYGNNVLYKKNGDERYPDFKLYKMIARNVNQHIPERQFEHACFNAFKTTVPDASVIDIDLLIKKKDHL